MENEVLSVSELNAFINQTLQFAYPLVVVEGEISSYKVNQGKWVFFDLKDDESTISCFMPIYQLKVALQDGMMIRAVSSPNLTKWGKFSLTVRAVELAGEGSAKKAFELLRAKFEAEGLFAPERKRQVPAYPHRVGLITSRQAAAFNDFVTILNDRWSGVRVNQAQVQVQGMDAPAQIVRAIEYFNNHSDDYDVLVVVRGGGSAEDLQAFNAENVVRAIYGSKIPTVVGIGHEDDVSLAELAADVRAATPTDAARRITADKHDIRGVIDFRVDKSYQAIINQIRESKRTIEEMKNSFSQLTEKTTHRLDEALRRITLGVEKNIQYAKQLIEANARSIASLDPRAILGRGYSIATVNGRVLKRSQDVEVNQAIVLQLHQGKLHVRSIDDKK
jgi:exodeoxyribonuclease VII large subunit